MNGCCLYKSQWKNIVKEKCCEYDKTCWELTCGLYEGIDIYIKSMHEVYTNIWPSWIYSSKNVHDIRRCNLLLRVVTGNMPGFNNNENICLLCQSRCVGPSGKLIHILECRETQHLRIEKWLDVEEVMPLAMKHYVLLYNTSHNWYSWHPDSVGMLKSCIIFTMKC